MHLAGTLSCVILALFTISSSNSQRITTIQLDGVQYFISRMNPYSPELNFFLAYQYCRSLGLQLVSFETKEKAESITQYLINAGYQKFDFWTSGNKLGTQMLLWMNTGSQFNATFNNMKKRENDTATFELPTGNTSPQRTARENGDNDLTNSCVAMKAPSLEWDVDDCTSIKDFICEQTRCYYYNYGSIPVSSAQGKVSTTTTQSPYTSSSSISAQTQKYVPMGINELVSNLRSTVSPKPDDLDISTTSSLKNEDEEIELGTNGPYDNFHSNAEMHDDPSALVDYHVAEENYASTVEPDTVTTYDRSSRFSL